MTDLSEIIVTDTDLATLAKVSPRHIRRLGLPKAGRNAYRLDDAIPALLESLSGGDAGAELTRERVRKLKAEATMAELQLAKACGEVAPISQFERAEAMRAALTRANMLNVPARVAMQIVGCTDESRIKAVLASEIRLALRQASEIELIIEDINDNDETEDCTNHEGDPDPEGGSSGSCEPGVAPPDPAAVARHQRVGGAARRL